MTKILRLIQLCALWLLVQFTHVCLRVSGLNWEACEVSNAELFLQVKIQQQLKALTLDFINA